MAIYSDQRLGRNASTVGCVFSIGGQSLRGAFEGEVSQNTSAILPPKEDLQCFGEQLRAYMVDRI